MTFNSMTGLVRVINRTENPIMIGLLYEDGKSDKILIPKLFYTDLKFSRAVDIEDKIEFYDIPQRAYVDSSGVL